MFAMWVSVHGTACHAYRPGKLEVNPISGYAPLTVQIGLPEAFIGRANTVMNGHGSSKWGRFGASITWGDGTGWQAAPGELMVSNSHTYEAPGTYSITAMWGGPGPRDGHESFSAIGTITVWARAISVSIVSPTMQDEFEYKQFPKVRWNLVTNRKVDLRFSLLDEERTVICTGTIKGIAQNVNAQETLVHPHVLDKYEDALRRGKRRFRVRIEALDEAGNALCTEESQAFSMLPKSE
jgi:hypothetical protein